ncbi:hypothetical protein HDV06_002725, partial [Boothiomyces sp. JEL0866]
MKAWLLFSVILAVDLQGWVVPGYEAAITKDYETLKPQYITVTESGLEVMVNSKWGYNSYSQVNVALVKSRSKYQYVTISCNNIGFMRNIWNSETSRSVISRNISTFVSNLDFTGAEIDWEQYSHWTISDYTNFKLFVKQLGDLLYSNRKKLIIVSPLIVPSFQHYFAFNYSDMKALPIDYFAVMAYDYQWDYGCGTPRSPSSWVREGVEYIKSQISNTEKII